MTQYKFIKTGRGAQPRPARNYSNTVSYTHLDVYKRQQETYASLRQEMLDRVPDTYDKRDTAPIPTAISPAAYTLAGFYLCLLYTSFRP